MDMLEDDMFEFSDEDLKIETPKSNPVEEQLTKQLLNLRSRTEKTINDLQELRDTTQRILKNLRYQAQYGKSLTYHPSNDLYTIDGHPVVKRKDREVKNPGDILVVKDYWTRIFWDKWVIGINLQNTSTQLLDNPQIYVDLRGKEEIRACSTFWSCKGKTFWYRVNAIQPMKDVVATVVLDSPAFNENAFCDAFAVISYQVYDRHYQTIVPAIRLLAGDTVDNDVLEKLSANEEQSILTLKSASIESIVVIETKKHPRGKEQLQKLLLEKSFKEISTGVYLFKTHENFTFCLLELLTPVHEETRLSISTRSNYQMNIMIRLLKDHFPNVTVQRNDSCDHAALALLEELKLSLNDKNIHEQQLARIKTDLLTLP